MSETRALNAALSGPVFHGAAARSALHASERHVERWAPEGPKATRAGSLRTLGFADRIAAPWMAAAMETRGARMMAQPTTDRSTPSVSWLFPRPWFQDELDWMAAARVRAEQTPQYLTTRGTYESARSSAGDVAMPMVAPELVAPSMASYGMPPGFAGAQDSNGEGYGQVQHGLRAYSPMVPFAAAAAAEVVAGTIGLAQRSGLASVAGAAGRSPILSALAVVAPSQISPARSALPVQAQAATPAPPPPTPPSTRVLIDAARASVTRIDDARHAPAPVAPVAPAGDNLVEPAPVIEHPASAESAIARAQPGFAGEPSVASGSELALADAASTSPQLSRALRTVDLLLSSMSTPAPSANVTPAFAPAAGPRVMMPAGLGGLVTALDAQQTTTHPMARIAGMPAPLTPALAASARALDMPVARAGLPRGAGVPAAPGVDVGAPATRDVPGFAPVWAAPATALGAIAAERARAVDHVAWSDRWLARFVGASPVALASLDVAFDRGPAAAVAAPRTLDVAAPEMSYLRPPMPASTLAEAIRASSLIQPLDARTGEPRTAAPAPRVAASPDRALRIDDNEAVSDDIFAAIAAAAAAPTRPGPTPRGDAPRAADRAALEPVTLTAADVVRAGSRPTIADLVSIAPPPAPGAGLAPGLASSPMAPAMAAMLPLPAAPVFDARALYPGALGSAYLGGLLARSAAAVGVVSAAPTMSALVAAAGVAAGDGVAAPGSAASAGAPTSLPFVGIERFSHAMGDARTWATRDLAIAPSSLRLAEAAPERVVLAAGEARRAMTMMSAHDVAAVAPERAGAPAVSSRVAPAAPDERAAEVAAEPAATTAPAPGLLESDLVGLRAALLAGGATSVPLAFAEYLPMLSAAMSAPVGAVARDGDEASTLAPASAPSVGAVAGAARSTAAAFDRSLPFVTSAAPGALAAPAGARGFALPAVGGVPAAADARMSRFGLGSAEGDVAGVDAATAPPLPGVLGARDSLSSLISLHAPVAATSTGRPGSLAETMLSWAVAEERAVTDLSFDFVAPEMVLAAKVYGLSPGAAAQAARLAVAGPGAIASLATSVDLTFLRGFQQAQVQQASASATAAQRAAASGTAAPSYAEDGSPIEAPFAAAAPSAAPAPAAAPAFAPDGTPIDATSAAADVASAPPMPSLAGSVLSSPRLPRGAFLWPEATVAALGLRALSPEGVAGMPVVALELLAAAAVADLGTWVTAFPTADQSTIANVIRGMGGTVPTASTTPGPGVSLPSLAAAPAGAPSATAPIGGAASATADGEAPDLDTFPGLAAAPRDIRARFESIYVALARTGDGQNLSPSARAARAMALLAREDGGTTSARERALAAWSMLPSVYEGGMDLVAPRDGAADEMPVETRPGLAALAARAGESLGSFVAPSAREVSSWSDTRGSAPSLAERAELPVYVNTASAAQASTSSSSSSAMSRPGRAFAQAGGGEPEIPAWFEAAARRMLDDRSPGGGMSLAELVLVTAAATPSKAIAASARGASPTAVSSTPTVAAQSSGGQKPDVEKLAFEVYQEVLRLIDIARERSGDPYQ